MLPLGPETFFLSPAVKNVKVRIYKTIILLVVLYRCETWSLTVREHKLRVFENRDLRTFGPKGMYSSPSIIRIIKSRRMRWAGHVARMGEKWNVIIIIFIAFHRSIT
jgi:hypothetical protein